MDFSGISPDTRCVFQGESLAKAIHSAGHPTGDSRWRAVSRVLRSTADSLACAILPASCALCDTPVTQLSRVPVCQPCWESLLPQSGNLCLQCGEALGEHAFASEDRAPGDYLCPPCRLVPPAFDRAVAFGLYAGTLRSLVHLFKFEKMTPIANPLGRYMAAQIAALPTIPQTMTAVPVPLFRARRRQRGFNQSELLARAVAKAACSHGMTITVEPKLLERRRATKVQSGLTPGARRRNLAGAFAVPGAEGGAKPLAGRDLLLIDDIYTTGATARACAAVLRRAGAAQIWVATAARAQKQELAEPVRVQEIPMEEDVAIWN